MILGLSRAVGTTSNVRKSLRALLVVGLLLQAAAAYAEFDHGLWDGLLSNHVHELQGGRITEVDYSALAGESTSLDDYLVAVASVTRQEFDAWPHSHQLAFLINAYNASTVKLVLSEYPEIDSIKDVGSFFSSPWSLEIVSLFGEQVSLDDIEHGMIRGWDRYEEPRIHFAVNCAAKSCPALRAEAYVGERLDEQLAENTRLFLSDSARNYFAKNSLYISKIFDWYAEDFERGWQGINSVDEFLEAYSEGLQLDAQQRLRLAAGELRIRYVRYDWDLNDGS